MGFKASNILPSKAYDDAKRIAVQVQSFASNRATSWAGGADASQILSAADNLKSFRDRLNDVKSTPGIAAYARDQEDDQAYDVAAEFSALLAAVDAAITQIVNDMPKDGSGYILVYQINADGSLAPRSFGAGGLSSVIAALNAIVAAVE